LENPRANLDHNARWTRPETLLLAVLGGVVFLDTLDLSLVQVALPAIGSELRLPEGQLQWIVSAFVATPAETVHAFTAGVYVSVASACLLVAVAVTGWRRNQRRTANEPRATTDATDADAVGADLLDLAA
jgi:membrane protein implicated in regulation of membrane protease activity